MLGISAPVLGLQNDSGGHPAAAVTVMDLADQYGLDVSLSYEIKVIREFDEALTAKYRQKMRGEQGALLLCKVKTKSRLKSNYSYYRILIVEDVQLIVNNTTTR